MRVAVLFEKSGVVRRTFQDRGHKVISVDTQPADDSSPDHLIMDVSKFLKESGNMTYDLIIMHPPCTALAVSGNRYYGTGMIYENKRKEAIVQTGAWFYQAKIIARSVCLENPVGVLSNHLGSPQYVQPYQFGHDASKKTGLWLYNLPRLKETNRIPGRIVNGKERWSNQTDSGQNRLPPSEDRADLRSKTYEGIAEAMADQWGN